MTHRVYNFAAGPATIPEVVLRRVQEELLDWHGLGMSVMEISHRGQDYLQHVINPALENCRKLLKVPDNYEVLLVSGSASHHFAMVPLNLLGENNTADYLYTGVWSGKALTEAKRYGNINIAMSSEDKKFSYIPEPSSWQLNPKASYVHYVTNETVNGVQFHYLPPVGDVPLVADMSSDILSRPIDISKYGLIYAGAQKNIGPAGLSIVIIRKDLVGRAKSFTPTLYNYQTYVEHLSMYNTPATFSIYLASLVFEWVLAQGGLSEINKINQRKASKLYNYLDSTDFYQTRVSEDCRSIMNVVFYLPTPELDALFVQEALLAGLANLKGHKLVGGIRASIYNAMPESGVDALIEFMRNFIQRYG